MRWYLQALKKSFVFRGRASRTEFWAFFLTHVVIVGVLVFSIRSASLQQISGWYALAVVPAQISVSVRRLHDTGRSGWWFFVAAVPIFGGVILLGLAAMPGERGENRFGLDPGQRGAAADGNEGRFYCPACGTPYRPDDYRSDAEHIYCSSCKNEVERQPVRA